MRASNSTLNSPWRHAAAPLAVWLVILLGAAGGLAWLERGGRAELEHRFTLRVDIAADFVGIHVADLIARERAQAVQFLSDQVVAPDAFARAIAAIGYPGAVLLDGDGRVLHSVPAAPGLAGTDLAARHEHLRIALHSNRPAVSPVVLSPGSGLPEVSFAVPYETPYGRRVIAGSLDLRSSALSAYLSHAIALSASEVYLVDSDGTVLGANYAVTGLERLADRRPGLAGALARHTRGAFTDEREEPGYFSIAAVRGTSWRLVASLPAEVLYAPIAGTVRWTLLGVAAMALLGLGVVALAGRGARNRAALRESDAHFRQIFDNALVGMLLSVPGTGRLVQVNAALCDMLGYTEAELTTRTWAEITHPDDVASSLAFVAETVAGKRRGFSQDKRYLHADGHAVPVTLTCTLLRDDRGRPQYFATQVIDISERYRLATEQRTAREELTVRAAELERANTDLQAAQQRTADLVAMLSHDVRQPLGVISGYCELLLDAWDHTDDRRKRRDLARIARAGSGMMELVEEVLTLTELDNADLRPRRAPTPLSQAVEQTLAGFVAEHRASIRYTIDDRAVVHVDARHLQQILVNLISNAGKYGEDGVLVSGTRAGDGLVEIAVSDAGEGVPAEFVPHLFERFSRADSGVAPTRKGTGLGLYIARQLAEANGGDIRYEPNQPRGSRFIVRLPAPPADIVDRGRVLALEHH
jgi:PAS domain S-box-containing protein